MAPSKRMDNLNHYAISYFAFLKTQKLGQVTTDEIQSCVSACLCTFAAHYGGTE